jgi:hypothetical protein
MEWRMTTVQITLPGQLAQEAQRAERRANNAG